MRESSDKDILELSRPCYSGGARKRLSSKLFDNLYEQKKEDEKKLSHLDLFQKKIWNIEDVASFTGYRIGTIYNLSSNGLIPKKKKRGLLYFIPDEILNWFLEGD